MKRFITLACLAVLTASTLVNGAPPAKNKKTKLPPTEANVKYGPHEQNVLNFWKAESDKPTPILIFIHGGGWLRGKKDETMGLAPYLNNGISVASIDYRLADQALVPAPLLDAARAVQFIRSKAKEWNLDKGRVALTGGSAGACTSLWLSLHDDLADPDNPDPVLRESTKPTCAYAASGQTFIDAKMVKEYVGKGALNHGMIWKTVGAKSPKDAIDNYESFQKLYEEYSPYNHLDKNDPPVLIRYGKFKDKNKQDKESQGIHSHRFGLKLKEKSDKLGAKVYYDGPESPEKENAPNPTKFIIDNLKSSNP